MLKKLLKTYGILLIILLNNLVERLVNPTLDQPATMLPSPHQPSLSHPLPHPFFTAGIGWSLVPSFYTSSLAPPSNTIYSSSPFNTVEVTTFISKCLHTCRKKQKSVLGPMGIK